MILGESGDLEYDPSLGARVKIAVSSAIHEQFLGGGSEGTPDSISGL